MCKFATHFHETLDMAEEEWMDITDPKAPKNKEWVSKGVWV